MKAILSGEGRTLVCLIFCLVGPFTAGPSSDLLGERDLAARLALVAPTRFRRGLPRSMHI